MKIWEKKQEGYLNTTIKPNTNVGVPYIRIEVTDKLSSSYWTPIVTRGLIHKTSVFIRNHETKETIGVMADGIIRFKKLEFHVDDDKIKIVCFV